MKSSRRKTISNKGDVQAYDHACESKNEYDYADDGPDYDTGDEYDGNKSCVSRVEKPILYDLTINAEWDKENDLPLKTAKDLLKQSSSSLWGAAWKVVSKFSLYRSPTFCGVPTDLSLRQLARLPWQIATSEDNNFVVILCDQRLEIRCLADDYCSVWSQCTIAADSFPQWRRLVVSATGEVVAFSQSSGAISVVDMHGSGIFQVAAEGDVPFLDLTLSLAALLLVPSARAENLLISVNRRGTLNAYKLGNGDHLFTFSFSVAHPGGVSDVLYHHAASIFVVGGALCFGGGQTAPSARYGLSTWRCLSTAPHVKLVTSLHDDDARRSTLVSIWRCALPARPASATCHVELLSLAPGGAVLASLDTSGAICLWLFPSLKLLKRWELTAQPGHDRVNAGLLENPKKRKLLQENMQTRHPCDLSWWSEKHLIVARANGSLMICDMTRLTNQFGEQPEWFEPMVQLTPAENNCFFVLECEKSDKRDPLGEEPGNDDDDDESAVLQKSVSLLRKAVYFMTDSETLQRSKKRARLIRPTYRLICFKSTTPEQLYHRKIEAEEYGEALALARAYQLDTDLVYKRQWEHNPVSVATISDYLSKISKKSWVLREVTSRVPTGIDGMRELLDFGLAATSLEVILELQDEFLSELDDSRDRADVELVRQEELKKAEQLDLQSLKVEQKELIRMRRKILKYSDRLSTYEEILGGLNAAERHYRDEDYQKMRDQGLIQLAFHYAHLSNWEAVDCLLIYHGDILLPHWLSILSNFPETLPPAEYELLLPELTDDGSDIIPYRQSKLRSADWSDDTKILDFLQEERSSGSSELLSNDCRALDWSSPAGGLTVGHYLQWVKHRAVEIDDRTRLVEHVIQLVELTSKRGLTGLQQLSEDIMTMEMLVFDCLLGDSFFLAELQKMDTLDRLKLIMKQSSAGTYSRHITTWLVPFLERQERHQNGSFIELLVRFVLDRAKSCAGLDDCIAVFELSKPSSHKPALISDGKVLQLLAYDAITSCTRDDQVGQARTIMGCLPSWKRDGADDLHEKLNQLEDHLSSAEILSRYSCQQPIPYIISLKERAEDSETLLKKLLRSAQKADGPAMTTEVRWRKLLEDILKLRRHSLPCLQDKFCYQMYIGALLCSSSEENIVIGSKLLILDKNCCYLGCPDRSKLDFDESAGLLAAAGQHHFNMSSSADDPDMQLARFVLSLCTSPSAQISEELDLITAVDVLNSYKLDVVPLQVRLEKERLKLIRNVFTRHPNAYKDISKIVKLARCLRVSPDCDASTLRLIARTALDNDDLATAGDACRMLMDGCHGGGWLECKLLAERSDLQNKTTLQHELMTFAVIHCQPHHIESILRARALLQLQIGCGQKSSLFDSVELKLLDLPQNTLFGTRRTLECVGLPSDSWSGVVDKLASGTYGASDASVKSWGKESERKTHENESLECQSVNSFYLPIMPNAYSFREVGGYSRKVAQLCEWRALRVAQVGDSMTQTFRTAPNIVQSLSLAVIPEDMTFALGLLLALPKAEQIADVFDSLPMTQISCQLVMLVHALKLHALRHAESRSSRMPAVKPTKKKLSSSSGSRSKLTSTAEGGSCSKLLPNFLLKSPKQIIDSAPVHCSQSHALQLQRVSQLFEDIHQSQMLLSLDSSVDTARFATDDTYKRDTVLGLGITTDGHRLAVVADLADFFNIPRWEVYMTFLETLFEESVSSHKIGELVIPDVLAELKRRPDEFLQRMSKTVLPTIDGCNHDRLLFFYGLQAGCSPPTAPPSNDDDLPTVQLPPEKHCKLLKKIRSVIKKLDYRKLLFDKSASSLQLLAAALTPSNVHAAAKLIDKIPSPGGGFLDGSIVFCAWSLQLFWHGETKDTPTPDTQSGWLHRYNNCLDFIKKLSPSDFVICLDKILFADNAILELETRLEIIKRALKYSRSKNSAGQSWSTAVETLQQRQRHLASLCPEEIKDIDEQIVRQLDRTRGEADQMEDLLCELLACGVALPTVELVMRNSEGGKRRPQSGKLLIRATSRLLSRLREISSIEEANTWKNSLNSILGYSSQPDDADRQDIRSSMREFALDAQVIPSLRLIAIELLASFFGLLVDEESLMIYLQTACSLQLAWPQLTLLPSDMAGEPQLTLSPGDVAGEPELTLLPANVAGEPQLTLAPGDVAGEPQRLELFSRLLDFSADSLVKLNVLAELLQVWPKFHVREGSYHPWSSLLIRCAALPLSTSGGEDFLLEKFLIGRQFLPSAREVKAVVSAVSRPVVAVKLLLLADFPHSHRLALSRLTTLPVAAADEHLLDLILQRHLLVQLCRDRKCVNPSLVGALLGHVVRVNRCGGEVALHAEDRTVAAHLAAAGFVPEAGMLLMRCRRTHRKLRTWQTALIFADVSLK